MDEVLSAQHFGQLLAEFRYLYIMTTPVYVSGFIHNMLEYVQQYILIFRL